MARWEFELPDIGEGVTEGEIVAWRVAAGDAVKEDQPIVEVMTDKATVTITAPRAGTVLETRGRVGETVAVRSVLVVFELDGARAARPREEGPPSAGAGRAGEARVARGGGEAGRANGATASPSGPAEAAPASAGGGLGPIEGAGPRPAAAAGAGAPPAAQGAGADYFNEKPLATPATRKLARDMNVDLRRIRPSGPQGRVTRVDVEDFVRAPAQTGGAQAGSAASAPPRPEAAAIDPAAGRADRPVERIPLAGLRRKIAHKMALAASKTASFTFVEECDATELKLTRERLKDEAIERGVKLSFLPFIVKAVVASLKRHPMLNATLDEAAGEIVVHKYYNVGIATATQAGLVVPVVKDADKKGIVAIAQDIERLAHEARSGKSKLEDLHGSTFTVTSLGVHGGLLATPIVNFPEVAILGVHRMKERPVVKDGQIVIGSVMLLSLSFDHRVVDGHVGAAFAYDVIGYLERPGRLLLEMA